MILMPVLDYTLVCCALLQLCKLKLRMEPGNVVDMWKRFKGLSRKQDLRSRQTIGHVSYETRVREFGDDVSHNISSSSKKS